jgi:RNase_H superfamily
VLPVLFHRSRFILYASLNPDPPISCIPYSTFYRSAFYLMIDIVYLDLETQRTANDAGGWNRKRDMGMSVGVTYSTKLRQYRIYSEQRVNELVNQLLRADLVVGFNIINFDFEVLMGYTILDLPHQLRTLDLLVEVEKNVGGRPKLENIAQATLGIGKTGDGIDAIKWWREKRVLEIAEYCCFDVKVTRLVHEFGTANKEIFYTDKFNRRQRIPIGW